jgi:hypothetical protein
MTSGNDVQVVLDKAKTKLPAYIDSILLDSVGEDSNGYDAIWIFVIFDETKVQLPAFLEDYDDTRAKLRDALRNAGFTQWPYFHVRSKEEHEAVLAGKY